MSAEAIRDLLALLTHATAIILQAEREHESRGETVPAGITRLDVLINGPEGRGVRLFAESALLGAPAPPKAEPEVIANSPRAVDWKAIADAHAGRIANQANQIRVLTAQLKLAQQ